MDLNGKNVNIEYLRVTGYPEKTEAKVVISEVSGEGILRIIDTFVLSFDKIYHGVDDQNLLIAIQEKLAALP